MTISVYPEYKESGVPWLGHVPEHWEVKALKYVASCNDESVSETTPPDLELQYVDISSVDSIRGITAYECLTFENAPSRARRIARNGDTIVSTVRTYLKAITPIVDPPPNLVVSTGFAVIRPKNEVFSGYLSYLLRCEGFVGEIMAYSVGISYPAINPSDLMRLRVCIPPLEEQRAIASFLDRKTAQIDELIAKKEALLKKLDEKRTTIITQAITKGLDPSVPMKDSGVEWIGEIPKHWEVKRLKHLLSEPLKYGANETAEETNPEYPRYIRITDIHEDGSLNEETFRSLPHEIAENYLLNDGDILFARSGATVGKTFIYNNTWGNAAFAGYLIRARVNRLISASFLYKYLQSNAYWHWISSVIIQATIQNVSAEKYAILFIPYPQFEEQLTIFEYIENNTAKIDHQKKQITKAIERLMEYRTALITNSATGKNNI